MNSIKTSLDPTPPAIVALQDPTERAHRLKAYRLKRLAFVFMACAMLGVAAFSMFVFLEGNSLLMIAQAVMLSVFGFLFLILFLVVHVEVKIITLYMALAQDKSTASEK